MKDRTKAKKSVFQKIMGVVDTILTVFILLVAALEITAVATKGNNYGVPSVFGYQISVVVTDSMAKDENGETLFPVGDGIVCKKVDFDSIQIGDDIFFHAYVTGTVEGVTTPEAEINIIHRVFGQGTDTYGAKYYLAHGVNKDATNYSASQAQIIYADPSSASVSSIDYNGESYSINAKGVLLGKLAVSSPVLGGFVNAMQNPVTIILLIIIPCGVIAVSSIIDIVKVKNTPDEELDNGYRGSSDKPNTKPEPDNDLSGFSEEEKEKLKKQMLEKMLADAENKKDKGGKD